MRVSSYDPDDSNQQPQNYAATQSQPQPIQQQQQPQNGQSRPSSANTGATVAPQTLGSIRKFSQKVATISQNYNEKSMLLSSDEEYQ